MEPVWQEPTRAPGAKGEDGDIHRDSTGKPHGLPAPTVRRERTDQDGGPGGVITFRYASAAVLPRRPAHGGARPARAGLAEPGGGGTRRASRAATVYPDGQDRPARSASAQVPQGQVFDSVDADSVGGMVRLPHRRRRVLVPAVRRRQPSCTPWRSSTPRLISIPANARAATLRQRLIQQQTPSGVSRDLDISPDLQGRLGRPVGRNPAGPLGVPRRTGRRRAARDPPPPPRTSSAWWLRQLSRPDGRGGTRRDQCQRRHPSSGWRAATRSPPRSPTCKRRSSPCSTRS